MSRAFHLGDVLTVTTGRLVAPRGMDGVYDLLDYLTGDNLMTHQLPRAATACGPRLLEQHPDLAKVTPPEEFADEAHVWRWLAEQVEQYGAERVVEPLQAEDHTRIDPLVELHMVAPHMQVIAIEIPGEPP